MNQYIQCSSELCILHVTFTHAQSSRYKSKGISLKCKDDSGIESGVLYADKGKDIWHQGAV